MMGFQDLYKNIYARKETSIMRKTNRNTYVNNIGAMADTIAHATSKRNKEEILADYLNLKSSGKGAALKQIIDKYSKELNIPDDRVLFSMARIGAIEHAINLKTSGRDNSVKLTAEQQTLEKYGDYYAEKYSLNIEKPKEMYKSIGILARIISEKMQKNSIKSYFRSKVCVKYEMGSTDVSCYFINHEVYLCRGILAVICSKDESMNLVLNRTECENKFAKKIKCNELKELNFDNTISFWYQMLCSIMFVIDILRNDGEFVENGINLDISPDETNLGDETVGACNRNIIGWYTCDDETETFDEANEDIPLISVSLEKATALIKDNSEGREADNWKTVYHSDELLKAAIEKEGIGGLALNSAMLLNGYFGYCYEGCLEKDKANIKINWHKVSLFSSYGGMIAGNTYTNLSDIVTNSRRFKHISSRNIVTDTGIADISTEHIKVSVNTNTDTIKTLNDMYKDVNISDSLKNIAVNEYKLVIDDKRMYVIQYEGEFAIFNPQSKIIYTVSGKLVLSEDTNQAREGVYVNCLNTRIFLGAALLINEYLNSEIRLKEKESRKRNLNTNDKTVTEELNTPELSESSKQYIPEEFNSLNVTDDVVERTVNKERTIYITTDEKTNRIKRVGEIQRRSCDYQFTRRGHWARSKKTGKRWWVREAVVNADKPIKETVYKINKIDKKQ